MKKVSLLLLLLFIPFLVNAQNLLPNPGFEDGDVDANGLPDSWLCYGQGTATLELVNDAATAHTGDYWTKITSSNGDMYLLYQATFPALENETWTLSAFIKDLSGLTPALDQARLKISAKNSSGGTFKFWEVNQIGVTSDWQEFSLTKRMPQGTAYIQAVIVIHNADDQPDVIYGIDDVKLEMSQSCTDNPGFEEGDSDSDGIPDFWLGGGTSTTSIYTMNDTTAHSGDYWAKVSVDNGDGWYVLYLDGYPASGGQRWSLRSWIKNTSPDSTGDFAFLKISAKNGSGSNLKVWEVLQEGVGYEWEDYSNTQIMPVGTEKIQPVLVVKKRLADGIEASYGFDDIRVVLLDTADVEAPVPPASVTAAAGTDPYFNEVSWTDVPGETKETYTIYASNWPINSLESDSVIQIASGIERDVQSYLHHLTNPFKDSDLSWYYAVTCTDSVPNVGDPAFSAELVNTANGVPTITTEVPADFAADGDISEWDALYVKPFVLKPSVNHIATGSFDNDDDLTVTGYIGMDNVNLYVSFEVIDETYSYSPTATYYKNDVVFLHIGLYELTRVHTDIERGEEPDYRFNFLSTYLRNVNAGTGGDTLYENGHANYNFTDFGNSNYTIEAKIPFDDILVAEQSGDTRFTPVKDMRIALDIEVCDSDQMGKRDGMLAFSPINDDESWKSPEYWAQTWITDTTFTAIDSKEPGTVLTYSLSQNYPNPFNPTTHINYSVAKTSDVNIAVYNVLGEKVMQLVNENKTAGVHSVDFNAAHLSTGVYFYQIKAGSFVQTKKMLLVK